MSRSDETISPEGQHARRQAARRPCDVCRRRKTRCEGSQIPGAKCFTCLDGDLECTYLKPARKRESKKSHYVMDLETRIKSLETQAGESEAIICELRSEIAQLHQELAAAHAQLDPNSTSSNIATHSSPPSNVEINDIGSISTSVEPQHDTRSATLQVLRTELHTVSEPPPASVPDDPLDPELEHKIDSLTLNAPRGFSGKASSAALVKAAFDLMEDVRRSERRGQRRTETIQSRSTSQYERTGTVRRPEHWLFNQWADTALTHKHPYRLPPPDLVAHLAELYFTRVHIYLPVLHRQTFERSVEVRMHHRDYDFAAIVLLVCAIGSRWSHDPRVLPRTSKGKPHLEQCGWEWFNQVAPGLSGKNFIRPATLYDLQYCCLVVNFLLGSVAAQPASWMLVGIGLRLAQDAGAHRRTTHVDSSAVERELWKRSFWVLFYLDGYVSRIMGRTCAIQYDDFDVEPPLECDDEYWDDPIHPFQQPPGLPSRIAFFNAQLRLSHILAFTLKVLYSLGKSRTRFAVDGEWEEHFVADLDSALNRWRDQVPDHLSWDPACADPVFFDQSVALHCGYCHLQIMVHRSFIPTFRKTAPRGLPSMTVCTNAARACANMVDVQRRRKGNEPINIVNMSDVFNSALVLLLNLWSDRRAGLAPNSSRDLENVHKCMDVLRLCEDRWPTAGMLWDILADLASVGQSPVRSSSLSLAQAYSEPHDAVAGDTVQLTVPGTFASTTHEPQYTPPYAPAQEYDAAGGEMPPIAEEMFANNTWFPPAAPFADYDATAMIDSDMIATWMNPPIGFGPDDWGTGRHP
ncbi:fungal-specific transcription factor domain-containing protein [Mycena epipterygia]|nr:fungal-specific transcription factor domain-containing protein [Mycena epipterygia]